MVSIIPLPKHMVQKTGSPSLGRARPTLKTTDVLTNMCLTGVKTFFVLLVGACMLTVLFLGRETNVVVEIKSAFQEVTRPLAEAKVASVARIRMSGLLDKAGKLQEEIVKVQRGYGKYMAAHTYGKVQGTPEIARVQQKYRAADMGLNVPALSEPHTGECAPGDVGLVEAPAAAQPQRSYCFGAAHLPGRRVCDRHVGNGTMPRTSRRTSFETVTLYNKTFGYQPFFFRGSDWKAPSAEMLQNGIAVVTQGTFNRMFHLVRLTELWQGPVSFALLVDSVEQLGELKTMLKEFPVLSKHVAIHAVWRVGHAVSDPDAFYPINMLRNMAQQRVFFPWLFVLDVDVIPNAPMATYQQWMERAATAHSPNMACPGLDAYVPPAVEMKAEQLAQMYTQAQSSDTLSKDLLVDTFLQGKATPMHLYFGPAYVPTNHFAWVFSDTVDPLPYLLRFEPYYIARSPIPLFNESFVNRGGNFAQQVLEMHVAGYQFYRLPHAFVVDIPHQTTINAEGGVNKPTRSGAVVENNTSQLHHQEDVVVTKWNELLEWLPHRYGFNVPSPFDSAFRKYRRQQQKDAEALWADVPMIGKTLGLGSKEDGVAAATDGAPQGQAEVWAK